MSFRIATWNAQNLTQDDPVFAEKLDHLAETLQAFEPDAVGLQEILDPDAALLLAGRLGLRAHFAQPDSRGNRVAILTRDEPCQSPSMIRQWELGPDIEVHELDENGAPKRLPLFPRPALQVTLMRAGRKTHLICAHLKSKLLTFGGKFSTNDECLRACAAHAALIRRAAEAASLRVHVSRLLSAGEDVILMGDLNDGPEAATTQILYGPPGSQPRGPEDANQASGAFQRADAQDSQRLFNVTKLVPESNCWSRKHNGQPELLDHILASVGLLPRVNGLRQVPDMCIFNDSAPNLVGAHPTAGGVKPDHAAVTALFF